MLQRAVELFEEERYGEAYPLFLQLARQGDSEAMYYLGLMYSEGWGVDKDLNEAIQWWKRADRRGSLDAKYMLQTICATSSVFSRE
ncbi:MAG: sel1 repeat family protein [Epsilonproteobacteria bacterium]|nr:hypothetical protein [Campylobacterota bacterium]NPA57639.1 sel1 repeat family protein [Campylobacterota bacterium]